MDDKDLERLQNIDCPAPNAERQAQALSAGLQAFRAAQAAPAAARIEQEKVSADALHSATEKNQKNFQGIFGFLRLMGTIHQRVGSYMMKKQLFVSTAVASVFAVTLGVHYQWWGMPGQDAAPVPTIIQEEVANPAELPIAEIKRTDAAAPGLDGQVLEETIVKNDMFEAEMAAADVLTSAQLPVPAPVVKTESAKQNVKPPAAKPQPARKEMPEKRIKLAAESQILADAAATSAPTMSEPLGIAEPLVKLRSAAPRVQRQMSEARIGVRPHPLPIPYPMPQPPVDAQAGDQFETFDNNPLISVQEKPVSTFSIDVDTAAYAYVRRTLNQGRMPQRDSVRVEELINYFNYDYAVPVSAKQPFLPSVAIYPTPWNADTKLMHVGIKGHELVSEQKKPSNLVFLIDVSGSMNQTDKLPLLIKAFRMLVNTLSDDDRVAIVTYAGRAGTVLDSTPVSKKSEIFAALEQLRAGGSTAGAQGIHQAYALAKDNFMPEGVNRVILATDGDFNVGASNPKALKSLIEEKRKSGIYLSVLGFGQGNYHDAIMQSLAQAGNGNAAYIDSLSEAQKVLVDEASATLFPIANDVKIQIEFNPAKVAEYRLIGYETRALKREDFNNDKVDAGDIGAGHTVTAIYEITPVGSQARLTDPLRYQQEKLDTRAKPTRDAADTGGVSGEYAFLKMRYKLPGEAKSELLTLPLDASLESAAIAKITADQRFAAAVAAFGQKLRGNSVVADFSYAQIIELANAAKGADPYGYRAEFIKLVRLAQSLQESQ